MLMKFRQQLNKSRYRRTTVIVCASLLPFACPDFTRSLIKDMSQWALLLLNIRIWLWYAEKVSRVTFYGILGCESLFIPDRPFVLIRNWYTYISVEWNEESRGIFAVAVSIRTTEAIQFLVLMIGLKGEYMSFSADRKENRPSQRCDWAPFRRRPCPFCIARCAPRSWWDSWRRPPCSWSLPLHRSSCLQTESAF